ncbi:DUF4173 domain-containing protein [Flavobacterium sp. CBA20B-1]|uniref:DUF4153 domain-containing protein n=1 Tax=unclassified Flavobacterium TaxID=196869 RepID=UPI002224FCEC|nr:MULTISPECIES: DUF4173 domain-containing protein [unclassified Flavobacterium]WCM42165.1 DUF4173 domain-containing protein [Flavobacterium sp. CBA20B-1]
MKKQFLIFGSAILFTILFYDQELGLNLSVFALLLVVTQLVMHPKLIHNKKALVLAACVVAASVSNAWLLSVATVFTVVITSFVFRYFVVDPQMKLISNAFNFVLSWPAFVVRFFKVDEWLEFKKDDSKKTIIKLFSYVVIPLVILSVFFGLYVSSSEWLSKWYNRYEWNINGLIIFTILLGFYISFVFWHIKSFNFIKVIDKNLKFHFSRTEQTALKPTFNYIPVAFEMRSGVITLASLNAMLLFFIVVFNIENAQQNIQHISEYSSRTHSQIYLIIVSVFLAMAVVLFFFKNTLNFIKNNKWLLQLTKIWIALNSLLICSAFYQNSVYISSLGLTYKRLGVYLFLIICFVGLLYSYLKVQHKKTNFYLIDRMSWVLFYSLVGCSLFNWGNIITHYNLQKETADLNYLMNLSGNEKALIDYYKKQHMEVPEYLLNLLKYYDELPLLSKQLYYSNF